MAENPIDIKKLFNFDDTTPLDQVIVKIQQLNVFYDALVASAQKGAASVTQSMQVMQKSIDALEQDMIQADATTKKGQETITNGAAITSKAVTQNEEYKKSINDLNATIKLLQDQIDKLSESNKKLPKDNETASGSLADLKVKLKDATDAYIKMGDATDAAIKQKALKNVTDLNTAVKNGQQVINDAKKATDIAAGSYNDLALKVANATKQLKAMEGGVGSNSDQFKALQKVVIDGNKQLKEFDTVLGNNQRNVGAYTESIQKAIPALEQLSPVLVGATEAVAAFGQKLLLLVANPIVLGIAAIIAAFAVLKKSVDIYIEGTIEGADKANKFSTQWDTAIELINSKFKKLGKVVFDAITDPDNKQTIIGGLAAAFPLLTLFAATLVKTTGIADEYNARLKINNDIAEMQIALRKEQIVLITDVSELELEKEKEMFAARDKENRSLQERYDAILLVNKVRKEEIALKQKEAQAEYDIQVAYFKKIGVIITNETKIQDLFNDTRVIEKKSYEQVTALAEARAKLTAVAKEEFQGTRRIQALKNGLVKEELDHLLAGIKQEKDARDKYNLETITADQLANGRILANQSSTLNEKIEAETKNLVDAKKLNEKALADELFAFREQALSKVVLDKETNDEITSKAGDDLKLRAQLILTAKNKQLDADLVFGSQEAAITQASEDKLQEIIKKSGENIVAITLEIHKRRMQAEEATSTEGHDNALIALDKSLHNREISLHNYNVQRAKIENQGKIDELEIQNDQLQSDLDYFRTSKDLEEKHAADILAIRKKLADNELLINDLKNKKQIENDKRNHELEKQLANQALDTIAAITDNGIQEKLNGLDIELAAFQAEHDKEISLAGDNADAKKAIDKRLAAQQADIAKQEARLKHDQAVKDRDLAEAKIIINTSVAISEVLPNIIAAALIGAIGALELAKVASTVIPAYFTGTSYSKEGLAQVAERGRELAVDRSGDITLYDKPQIAYLAEGTKILNNSQTEPILEKMDSKHMDLISHQLVDVGLMDIKHGQSLNREVIGKLDEVKEATRRNKPVQVDYAKVGAVVYEFKKEEETYVRRIKALSMGAWMK